MTKPFCLRALSVLCVCLALNALSLIAPSHARSQTAAFDVRANYTKSEHQIAMRDGKKLFTVVYAPKDTSHTYPFLMERTPYSAGPYGAEAYRNALGPVPAAMQEGYIFVYQDVARAEDLLKRRQELLDLGVVAKREVEESEVALKETQKKIEETNARMNEVDQLVAEVTAAEELAKHPSEKEPSEVGHSRLLLVRYTGRSAWSLASDYAKVDAYFRQTFGRALPVSAFGQTETHNRLGFDHTNALDVAVHPDSVEGQALQAYLRAAGISFLAIRGAIAGSATGAHIHIGAPSRRSSL